MRYLIIILLLACSVNGLDAANVLLSPRDAQTGEHLDNMVIYIFENNTVKTYYLEQGEILPLIVNGYLSLGVDNLSTPALDYYAEEEIITNKTIAYGMYVYPVGSLNVEVYDGEGNLLPKVPIEIICSEKRYDLLTNSFGEVNLDRVPMGICDVRANYNGLIGKEQALIDRGSKVDSQLIISTHLREESNFTFLGVLIIILVGYFGFKKFKRISKAKSAVISTLSPRDQSIIRALIKYEILGFSQLQKLTDMPKPTLSRRLVILESKKLLNVEKIGRSRRISLSDWYRTQ